MSDKDNPILSDYLSEIESIDGSGLSLRNKYIRLKRILERSCKEITLSESLQFPSLFSRLVFIAQKYELPKLLEWKLQNIRIKSSFLLHDDNNLIYPHQYQQAKAAIEQFLLFIGGDRNQEFVQEEYVAETEPSLDRMRVQVTDIDAVNEIILCKGDVSVGEEIRVRYNITGTNDVFNETISRLWIGAQMNLIDVKVDEGGYYIPKMFVLEPDYLIDASSMAECFQSYGSSYLYYFRRKFEPVANSKHILLGNLANFFLDELIYATDAEELTFNEVFMKSFRIMPFEYASCKDIKENVDFIAFMQNAERQFNNIKRVVLHDMPANGFDLSQCTLEPSFFCEKFGFQGRLDLLQLGEEDNSNSRIIELKSGKTPFPQDDVTKIALNHETQTAIYRMMIQSVFGKEARHIFPNILYSSADSGGENIRFAAIYQQLEKEIINTRNMIVATEHDLYIGDGKDVGKVFDELFDPDNYERMPQFFVDRLEDIKKVLDNSSQLEKAYFYRFVSFVSRELYLQKMGDESYDSAMSVSALWNTSFEERKEALELISDLTIDEIDDSGKDMVIRFNRRDSADCVNFREGEICILYPRQKECDSVLTNQILKGTVVEISSSELVLRFRYKQRNRRIFSTYKYWAVEHDKLDHSYNAMFKNIFAFLSAPIDKKELLLALRPPVSSFDNDSRVDQQSDVIEKAMAAEDYFLIVGPPGTGKTSIFARQLIERFYSDENVNILVVAYTNRAVDELCSAICNAFNDNEDVCEKYIRIGTGLSSGEEYRHRLLQNISDRAQNRKSLLQTIADTRIFVGTLASIAGKPELFSLKHFHVAIIDEASQILESQIIGLLPQFDKFIMIGDHKQLSTITLQHENKSRVENSSLNSIGLFDCRESLFERLFRVCENNNWSQAYDTLVYHGRMHEDIADLVNAPFYENKLRSVDLRQREALSFGSFDNNNLYQALITTRRVAFIPVREVDATKVSDKMNEREAEEVVALAKNLLDIYKANGINFDAQKTLGIITPYRNQIALIKQKLEETGIAEFNDIMVDTVERFQGSQRDVIILSFCFNRPYQMQYFCNMNREGTVDRKLNVALTRAREQLFMVGNDCLLMQNPLYRKILKSILS